MLQVQILPPPRYGAGRASVQFVVPPERSGLTTVLHISWLMTVVGAPTIRCDETGRLSTDVHAQVYRSRPTSHGGEDVDGYCKAAAWFALCALFVALTIGIALWLSL